MPTKPKPTAAPAPTADNPAFQEALFAESEDADDEGGEDVQHYPLPDALRREAERLLGPSEVEHILSGPMKGGTYYLDSAGRRVYT